MINLIIVLNIFILCFFIFSVLIYTLLLVISLPDIVNYFKLSNRTNIHSLINKKHLPPITIIISSYQSADKINNAVWSALKSNYPNLYVIVINDGTSLDDNSVDVLIETFALTEVEIIIEEKIKTSKIIRSFVSKTHPNLMLIEKEHGGTGDTLNVGVNVSFTPYIVTLDSDSIIHPDAITEMMYYIVTNKQVIAVGGGVYLLNGCTYKDGVILQSHLPKNWVAALQSNEYLRSHLFHRTAWNHFGGTMSYSGTNTAFYRQAVIDVNGFDTDNFAQDAEIIIKMHEYMRRKKINYNIGFTPSVTVWTEVPCTLKSYSIQQDHWRRGLLRSTLRYWYMFFNPRYKIQGMFSYPIYMLLEMFAPYIEFMAYFTVVLAYIYGILNGYEVLLYMILAWGFSSYITVANAFINIITFNRYTDRKDIFKSFALAFIDMLGFRQYVTLVKVWSTIHYGFNRLIGRPL